MRNCSSGIARHVEGSSSTTVGAQFIGPRDTNDDLDVRVGQHLHAGGDIVAHHRGLITDPLPDQDIQARMCAQPIQTTGLAVGVGPQLGRETFNTQQRLQKP
jgi:hypothetical protein